ncbi:Cylicin-1, putative [Pediculus humanus corporis]|uniref:Cylicin-1, putative n=1 Tax=Pediculus humanus subsp. corporis TaxID=121224 RepID=E0VTC7_PEDHC|nr:Cylicin-1, putative [Pediculus humanus corporis]EEB16633.1 Cylicin-1, putative [Pediculus humanus corporis]
MIYKRVTDDEANKLFYFLQKYSREWPLLNNVTWEENGAIFADVTYGSYIIITIGLIIGQCSGELKRCRKMENFFLIVGAILFIATGSLELAALESVEERLVDNAAILGVFSLVAGFLFIIDLLTASKRRKRQKLKSINKEGLSKLTQTEEKNLNEIIQSDVNGNIQTEGGGHRIPKNAVKLLPTSPVLSEYVFPPQKYTNNQYLGPVDYYPEPLPIDKDELKTHEGKIRYTESFLRSEKGLYPNLRKGSEQDRSNNHYFIPTGYVLVPAEQFHSKSPTKSDSGIGESYTPPSYTKVIPSAKLKTKREKENFLDTSANESYPLSRKKSIRLQPSGKLSKTPPPPSDAYFPNGKDAGSDSWHVHGNSYKVNSSDLSENEGMRPDSKNDYEMKQIKPQKAINKNFESEEDSTDEHKRSYSIEEYSRPSSRFSQESREWYNKHKGNMKYEGHGNDQNKFSYSKRSSPFNKSVPTSPFVKPKSILRFDDDRSSKKQNEFNYNKNLQYDSLDSKKIAEDLKTLKEITTSIDYEQENYMLKQKLRKEYEEREKLKQKFKKQLDTDNDDSDDEKNRRVSEKEEQYFGLKDLKQSHKEKKFEPLSKAISLDTYLKKGDGKEINDRMRDKYFERESQASREAQEFRDLIDEHSDETNYSQSTDEEIRLRVETPGSYKSEALVWVENPKENQPSSTSPPISPTHPGYVLYRAQNWPESPSPTDRFNFNAKEAQQISINKSPTPPIIDRLKNDYPYSNDKMNSQKSRLLDFDQISENVKDSVMTSRQKGSRLI